MAKELKLPQLSEDADEGTVAEVMIKEGDTIEKDDSVIAVESDKATVEVPAEEGGTVKEVKVSEGDSIKTGDVIAVLEDEDESSEEDEGDEDEEGTEEKEENSDEKDESDKESEEDEDSDEKEEQESDEDKDEEKREKQEAEGEQDDEESQEEVDEDEDEKKKKESDEGEESEQEEDEEKSDEEDTTSDGEEEEKSEQEAKEEEKESSESDEPHAAPGAKKLARERDVKLKDIDGSGPDGLITADDVKKAAGLGGREHIATESVELPDFSQWGTVERKSLSQIRKATARQTQSSWQTVPHVTQFDEADVADIEEYIGKHQKEAKEKGSKMTITTVLTKVIASALHQFPKFNASIDMEAGEVILKKYIHIGIAVDTDDGLLVPIVRNVDEKSIVELASEITELAEKARNQELSGEDMEGGNFIISNLGGIGGTQFTPIVFHPQVAILGVSEMATKPVYSEKSGSFEPQLTLPLSLSYDHRLIDGAEGARFLRYVCNALEDPYKALLGE